MPNLQEQLKAELREAMRSGNQVRRDTLRLLLSAIHNAEIEARSVLDDKGVLNVVTKEAKQRRESIAEYAEGNRPDLVAQEEAELAILSEYLPAQISQEELVQLVNQFISQAGATTLKDKGRVMPLIMAELRGQADGAEINRLVTEALSQDS